MFIAVQPCKMQLVEKISADVEKSKKKLIGILKKKNWRAIKALD
ncbi:MAG: hypothetical protein Q8N60_01780 [Candidatus Diapherotrites archaeon]|nr:hypothetical protein [Candidatus Diapherotrites archaeon]